MSMASQSSVRAAFVVLGEQCRTIKGVHNQRCCPWSCGLCLCMRRQVLMGDECHIFHYERGGISALGGCVMHTVRLRSRKRHSSLV